MSDLAYDVLNDPPGNEPLRQEVQALRRCLRDAVAFASLRSMWTGRPLAAIASLFADALIGAMHLDLVCVHLDGNGREPIASALRTAADPLDADRERELVLAATADSAAPLRIPGPWPNGELTAVRIPFGSDAQYGFLLVGSSRPGFPDDFERALLTIGSNEAARLLAEREVGARRHEELLARRLVQVQEEERRAIARDLHDEVGQLLTGLGLMLDLSAGSLGSARVPEMRRIVSELIERVRDLSMDLRPAMLDDLGVLPTLLWHIERFERQTGIKVRLRHANARRRGSRETEITAFRVVQEALTNVARHAGVAEVTVELWSSTTALGLAVTDHGRGFVAEEGLAGRTRGLDGMRERCRLAGGLLAVESAPGAGTRVSAELPLGPPTLASVEDGGENA